MSVIASEIAGNITVQTIRQTEIKTNYINLILKKETFLFVSQYDLLAF